jgi:hypothetical protein
MFVTRKKYDKLAVKYRWALLEYDKAQLNFLDSVHREGEAAKLMEKLTDALKKCRKSKGSNCLPPSKELTRLRAHNKKLLDRLAYYEDNDLK